MASNAENASIWWRHRGYLLDFPEFHVSAILTHCERNKMANILLSIFSIKNHFISIHISLKFAPQDSTEDKSVSIVSGNDLAPNGRRAIIWNKNRPQRVNPVYFINEFCRSEED